jgi:hypothetical protein
VSEYFRKSKFIFLKIEEMYIPPDEYLNLIDQINALTYHNTRCWEDNITLGREVIKQRQLASKYRQYPWR